MTLLARHRAFHSFLFLRRERDRSSSVLEFLHVDARVVAALDRADDDSAAPSVEQRDRRRLVAAGSLVGVVTNDRALREGFVEATVDTREPGGDLVYRSMEVVDSGLQRDGEVDEVTGAAPEHYLLR